MSEQLLICQQNEIEDPGSRGFNVEFKGKSISGFVVKKDEQFFAYLNSCPHTGAPLDCVEHQFLDMDGALIQCAVHDARFNIEKGLCLSGPCVGDSLQELTIIKQDNQLFLLL